MNQIYDEFSLGIAITTATLEIFCLIFGTICASVLQGFFIRKILKLLFIFFYTMMIFNDAFNRYLSVDHDWEINIFGNHVSLRSIIVNKGFDLCFWFTVLFIQTLFKPNELDLVSEIGIEWTN